MAQLPVDPSLLSAIILNAPKSLYFSTGWQNHCPEERGEGRGREKERKKGKKEGRGGGKKELDCEYLQLEKL